MQKCAKGSPRLRSPQSFVGRMRSALGCSLGAVLLLALPARADGPGLPSGVHAFHPRPWVPVTARLEYTREASTQGVCPSETAFRDTGMSAFLGYDPFRADGKGVPIGLVRLVVGRFPLGFTSSYELFDMAGVLVNRNKFRVRGTDRWACRTAVDLAGSEIRAVFTIHSLDLGEQAEPDAPAEAKPPEPAKVSVPVEAPPYIPPTAPAPRPRVRDEGGLYLGADIDLNAGIAPIGSAGGSVWAGWRFRQPAVSVEVGLRGTESLGAAQMLFPRATGYVPYRWTYVSAVAVASVHRGPLFFGPLIDAGSLTAHTDDPRSGLGSQRSPGRRHRLAGRCRGTACRWSQRS